MRRLSVTFAIAGLLLVAMVGTTVAAKPAASFRGYASDGEQGSTMLVQAKVLHAVKGTSFGAEATVHFASGDVTVTLARTGRSFVARAHVPVGETEALGPITIDVVITYGGVAQPTIVVSTDIVPPAP